MTKANVNQLLSRLKENSEGTYCKEDIIEVNH